MKYSKKLNKKERNELYSIYIYLGYNKTESFEKYCFYHIKIHSFNEKYILV
jgi:hypothetical protein